MTEFQTQVYARAELWPEGTMITLPTPMSIQGGEMGEGGSIMKLVYPGGLISKEQRLGLMAANSLLLGLTWPDGSRQLSRGRLARCYGGSYADTLTLHFEMVETWPLPMTPEEAERRANIAAAADRHRLALLEAEERAKIPQPPYIDPDVRLDYEDWLRTLWRIRSQAERDQEIEKILESITNNIFDARD